MRLTPSSGVGTTLMMATFLIASVGIATYWLLATFAGAGVPASR